MSQSPVAKDVVLELGTKDGTAQVQTTIQTGTTQEFWFDDPCRQEGICDDTTPINTAVNFNDLPKDSDGKVLTNLTIIDVRSIGNSGFATHPMSWYDASMGNNPTACGYPYMIDYGNDPEYNLTLILTMQHADGSNVNFNGIYNSKMNGSNGTWVDNHRKNGNESTEQGRILYLQPSTNTGNISFSTATGLEVAFHGALSFEIMDGCENQLLVRGTGKDAPWTYINNNTSLGNNANTHLDDSRFYRAEDFLGKFNCHVSPYVHRANFIYDNGILDYNYRMEYLHCSYVGLMDDAPKVSPTFFNGDILFGIRSKEDLLNCEDPHCQQGVKINISIVDIQDCRLEFLYGENTHPCGFGGNTAYAVNNNGLGGTTGTTPWTWQTVSSSGTHEICVPYDYDPVHEIQGLNLLNPRMDITDMQVAYGGGGAANAIKRFWTSQNEFFRLVPTGENPTLKISKFEVFDLNTELTTTSVPVMGTTGVNIDTYTYKHLDILDRDQELLALTFTSADLRDPSKRAAGFSKTFEIPASNHNQRWIKVLTGVGSVKNKEKIGWHKARIQANGIIIFEGFARIEESITGQGGRYKCHILQDPTYWPELLKGLKICELPFPTHEKNYQNVVNSWSLNNAANLPYVYPAINYGAWYPGTNANPQPNQSKSLRDFHPAVYVKALVDKIFEGIGYTLESDFMETHFFRKLIIPYTSGNDYNQTGMDMGENGDFAVTADKNGEDNDIPNIGATGVHSYIHRGPWWPIWDTQTDPANIFEQNTSHSSGGGGYTCAFGGRYIIQYDCQFYINQGGSQASNWTAWVTINGKCIVKDGGSIVHITPGSSTWAVPEHRCSSSGIPDIPPYNVSFPQSGGNWTDYCGYVTGSHSDGNYVTMDLDFEIDLQQGDVINIVLGGCNRAWAYSATCRIKNQNFRVWPHPNNTAIPPSTVSLQTVLPCVKQLDLLKGLTNMFNLYWTADETTKKIQVEPYNDFFDRGKIVDWTGLIDKTSWSDKFLIEELAKLINFKYKVDNNDKIVELRNTSMFTNYGSPELWALELENGELYRKEEQDMGNKVFSPTMSLRGQTPPGSGNTTGDKTFCLSSADGPFLPVMWGDSGGCNWGWFNNTTRPDNETKFNFRILNYGGLRPCDTWQLTDDSGTAQNQSHFPYAYTYDYHSPGGDDNLAYHNIGSGATFERGLFDKYYGQLYEKISGGSAMRTAKFDLSPTEISVIEMRDIVRIDIDAVPTYWTINKIKDYKPGKDELTEVELIEWKWDLPQDKGRRQGGGTDDPRGRRAETNYGGNENGDRKIVGTGESGMTVYTSATIESRDSKMPASVWKRQAILDENKSKRLLRYDGKGQGKSKYNEETPKMTVCAEITVGDNCKLTNDVYVYERKIIKESEANGIEYELVRKKLYIEAESVSKDSDVNHKGH